MQLNSSLCMCVMLCPKEETEQFHFCEKGKYERGKICSLILHGGKAGREVKFFCLVFSNALENSHCGREGLKASWQLCAEDDDVGGIKINSLSVYLISFSTVHLFFPFFFKLGRLLFRAKNKLSQKGGKKIPPVKALGNKQLLQNRHNCSHKSHSSCKEQ